MGEGYGKGFGQKGHLTDHITYQHITYVENLIKLHPSSQPFIFFSVIGIIKKERKFGMSLIKVMA